MFERRRSHTVDGTRIRLANYNQIKSKSFKYSAYCWAKIGYKSRMFDTVTQQNQKNRKPRLPHEAGGTKPII